MTQSPPLKIALKRGALLAAANWPLVLVQFVAEGTLKLLLAVPVVGGISLVVLLLGADVEEVLAGDVRHIIASVFIALRANPGALVAFVASFLVVMLGGSVLTFVVKAGTVSILAEAEAQAGPIERPPLRLQTLRSANVTNIEPFLDGCRRLWRRYVKLGACLLAGYGVTAALYLGIIFAGYNLAERSGVLLGWSFGAVLASSALVVWITLMNFLYLLTQIAIATEDLGVRTAMARVAHFIRTSLRDVAGIFGVVLLLVVLATVVSILATAGLGLVAFVPLAGLAMVPLQVAAWLLRGFVFEYLALTALSAYLTQYRHYLLTFAAVQVHDAAKDAAGQHFA